MPGGVLLFLLLMPIAASRKSFFHRSCKEHRARQRREVTMDHRRCVILQALRCGHGHARREAMLVLDNGRLPSSRDLVHPATARPWLALAATCQGPLPARWGLACSTATVKSYCRRRINARDPLPGPVKRRVERQVLARDLSSRHHCRTSQYEL